MMQYCKKCILPDTRPNLVIMDDGICNACYSWKEKKEDINWKERESHFQKLVKSIKNKQAKWDCVIPVSGGKDSTWQVIKAIEYGLRPLCVTWRTPARSKLGQQNLDNLIQIGVDHVDFSINPKVEKKFVLKTLKKCGTVAIPMHMALFAIPLQIAINYAIPLVLWGENSAIEYGGKQENLLGFQMTREWLETYGVTQGTSAEDWVDNDLTLKDLSPYFWPTDEEMKKAKVTAAFLGWYFSWDPQETYRVAKRHGFQALQDKPKTGYYKFSDVDDNFLITIHHWLKWYKFGFTRLWDNLALEIRNNRMSREEAISIIEKNGSETPTEEIDEFCSWVGISTAGFYEITEKFRNKNIWIKEKEVWKLKNFLLPSWSWR